MRLACSKVLASDIPVSVRLIMLARACWFLIPLSPITVVYLHDIGLPQAQILSVFTLFLIVSAILDVPSSVLSEMFSRRGALVLACITKGIGGALLVWHPSYERVLLAYVFIAIANGIFSGVDVSLLIAECEGTDLDPVAIRNVQARSYLWTTVVSLVSAFVGGVGGWYFGLAVIALVNAGTAWTPLMLSVLYLRHAKGKTSRLRLAELIRPIRSLLARAGSLDGPTTELMSSNLIASVFLTFLMGNLLWLANLSQIRLATVLMTPAAVGLFACAQIGYAVPLSRFIRSRGPLLTHRMQPALTTAFIAVTYVLNWQSAVPIIMLGAVMLEFTRSYVVANISSRVAAAIAPEYRASVVSLLGVVSKALGAAVLAMVSIDPDFMRHYLWALVIMGIGLQAVYLSRRTTDDHGTAPAGGRAIQAKEATP
jgi:MFS family permease